MKRVGRLFDDGEVLRQAHAAATVGIFLNGGWDLTINQPGSSVVSIYALTTTEGAAEVAESVRGVLHGEIPDPF
ncbi:hypothetical protein ACTMTI_13230 [Nonomuraea sp. H19]|uniref:hypothetical protein n=1 Tax=Nonomuraea sp. H19 TaxID=3452206 RepID=UPI003F8B9904